MYGLPVRLPNHSWIARQLFADALALGRRGLLESGRVEKLRSGVGYKNVAFDVVGLVQLFRERAKELAGKTAVTPQELDHAAELAQQLVTAVGLKEQSPLGLTAAALLRQQAFTLFTQAYDEARRAIGYLRWHPGDAGLDDRRQGRPAQSAARIPRLRQPAARALGRAQPRRHALYR